MALTRPEVSNHIQKVFHGVTLGNGVGLLEGQGLDDYADEATRKAYRERDEKQDWTRIPAEALNRCNSSLSFFDAEGMRFHLPAFMIAELNGDLNVSCVYHLAHLHDYAKNKLVTLSREERRAVREFLLLVRDAPDYEFDRPQIEQALSDYWMHDETRHES
jgi:hypothetical protein